MRITRRSWILTGIALSLTAGLAVSTAVAGPDRHAAAVGGRVLDGNGDLVGDAAVRLVNADGEVVARTMTDDRGIFIFRHVRPGRYVIQAAKPDVGRGAVRVGLRPGETERVRIQLGR